MTNEEMHSLEELRNAYKQAEHKKTIRRRHRWLQFLGVSISLVVLLLQSASSLYVAELSLAQPRGLDSVTNTDLFEAFYPVGAIYQTTENINPGTVFGGTWSKIAPGRVLLSAGASYPAGSTGGNPDGTVPINLSGTATGIGGNISLSGTTTAPTAATALSGTASNIGGAFSLNFSHTLTTAQMPAHTHSYPAHYHNLNHYHPYAGAANTSGWPNKGYRTSSGVNYNQMYWRVVSSANTSSNSTTNTLTSSWSGNVAYYGPGNAFGFTTYGTASGLSGTASASIAANSWTGSAAASGAISGLTGNVSVTGGTIPDKTMQPYVVVYTWERIA